MYEHKDESLSVMRLVLYLSFIAQAVEWTVSTVK
jgi:hypothetical protein